MSVTPAVELPHSEETERAVLACVLLWPKVLPALLEVITSPDMFYLDRHRDLWLIYLELQAAEIEPDGRTIRAAAEERGVFEKMGGAAFLAGLDLDLPDLGRFRVYAGLLVERYRRRRTRLLAAELATVVDVGVDLEDTLARGRTALDTIVDLAPGIDGKSLEEILTDAQPPQEGEQPRSLPLFCPELTKYRLLAPGLTLLAGRPGHGKSALALKIADHVAHHLGRRVLHLTLEMTAEELASRLLCGESGVEYDAYLDGRVSRADRDIIGRISARLTDLDRWIIRDRFGHTLGTVLSTIHHEHTRDPLALAVVDYLGLIQGSPGVDEVQSLGEISRALSVLGTELGIPILGLHQMQRRIYGRTTKSPELADLRGSGKLEENAHRVVFVTSPYQFAKEAAGPDSGEPEEDPHEIFVHVRKNRGGRPFGDIPLYADMSRMKITSRSHRKEPSWD